jgi:biopolymer transport protein ExbB
MSLLNQILLAGPLVWMLLALSVLSLALIFERVCVHAFYPRFSSQDFVDAQQARQTKALEHTPQSASQSVHGARAAFVFMQSKHPLPSAQRQELAETWLLREKRYLVQRLKLLALIAAVAPLLGLLGTVFGIIEMFRAIAETTSPVTPALLADGLWAAMFTTAVGLMIAIPSMLVSHGFELLAQWRLDPIQDALNDIEHRFLLEDSTVSTLASVA